MHLVLLSSVLLLLSASTSGQIDTETDSEIRFDDKHITCCKELTTKKPRFEIKECKILPRTEKCLESVVFTDELKKMYCIDPKAPWLRDRKRRLERNQNGVKCVDHTKA